MEGLERKRGAYLNYPKEIDPAFESDQETEYNYVLGKEYENFAIDCKYSENFIRRISGFNQISDNKVNIRLIQKAVIFAKKWHGNDMRKNGIDPFYSHPLSVAEIVAEYYFKTDVIIAAILHDVVEDTTCTVEILKEHFNERIAEIVDRLTKIRIVDGKKIKLSLEEMMKKLYEAKDYETLFIKQVDRIHNLETIESMQPHKQKKTAEESSGILLGALSYICERLNISGKFPLESRLSKLINNTLRKSKEK